VEQTEALNGAAMHSRRIAALRKYAISLRDAIPAWFVVAAVATVALLPQFSRGGPEMDEGAVLTYATRVLGGAVPYRDFFYYGPGNLWNVAGAFAIFGAHQNVERAVGLLYIVVTIVAVYVLVRRASPRAAVVSTVMTIAVATDSGIWPYASYAAIAFLTLSILLATRSGGSIARHSRLRFAAAGLCAGWCVLCRFDFGFSILLTSVVVLVHASRSDRCAYLLSLTATVLLYVPYLVLSGTAGIHRELRELANSGGRRLPLPAPFALPTGGLWFGGALALAVLAIAGAVVWRRRSGHGIVLVAAALAAAGQIPLVLSRTDAIHLEPMALLVYGLLPLAAVTLAAQLPPVSLASRALKLVVSLSVVWGVGVLVLLLLVIEGAFLTGAPAYGGTSVRSEGRTFILRNTGDAAAVQRVLSTTDKLARRGQSLFVGPYDLRRTLYAPTYLYFLLPQLRPASYYTVISPGVANRPGSGLVRDLRHADWLILTSKWDAIREPNSSSSLGSAAPNSVVRRTFCLRLHVGAYRLYESRRAGASCGSFRRPAHPAHT
jgi:hypothetical protein